LHYIPCQATLGKGYSAIGHIVFWEKIYLDNYILDPPNY